MFTEKDIQEIKNDLGEIKRLLKNAGFVNSNPARVHEISKEAQQKSEKIRERLYGNSSNR
jgi:valyl-tRNA synthetase